VSGRSKGSLSLAEDLLQGMFTKERDKEKSKMETNKDKTDERFKAYAQEKVVARLVETVKEETAKQEAVKTLSHSPKFIDFGYDREDNKQLKKWLEEHSI